MFCMVAQLIAEPPANQVLRIGQRAFGYLDSQIEKAFLETIGLGPCKGLYLEDRTRDFQAFAHLDGGFMLLGIGYVANQFIEFLIRSGLTEGQFNQINIIDADYKPDKSGTVDDIRAVLAIKGYRNVEVIRDLELRNVLIDRKGAIYKINPGPLPALQRKKAANKYGLHIVNSMDNLLCNNTDTIIAEQPDIIYPGVGRIAHNLNGHGGYCEFRIPIPESFDIRKLDKYKQKGISISLRGGMQDRYISIVSEGYRPEVDGEETIRVNKLAARIVLESL